MEDMEVDTPSQGRKRKSHSSSQGSQHKRPRCSEPDDISDNEENVPPPLVAGKILRVTLRNFMCHTALEVNFNERVNFVIGANGSGKSAILTALTLGLGARAKITDRGKDIKNFIKKGKASATIEIKLSNRGPMAYQMETYGDSITIVRNITQSASNYKIKNWRGDVISQKKEDLNSITSFLNIQIDNPICIMNQDMSRAFLKSYNSSDKYNLFMKATRLDLIGDNYKKAMEQCSESQDELKEAKNHLKEQDRVINALKRKIKTLESLEQEREKLKALENELKWAKVIVEERLLADIDKKIHHQQKIIDELENGEQTRHARQQEIGVEIESCASKIATAKAEAEKFSGSVEEIRNQYNEAKKANEAKKSKCRNIHDEIKRYSKNINELEEAIKEKEKSLNSAQDKRAQVKEEMDKKIAQLDEVNANFLTKSTDLVHFEEYKGRLNQEVNSAKVTCERLQNKIQRTRQDLDALKRQSNNSLSVYGPNMPRLLKRIEEEYNKGRLKQMPRGPIGRYLSMKDSTWIPAVESVLSGMIQAFCVDNKDDAKIVNLLLKEVLGRNERMPTLYISQFNNRVHDVSSGAVRSEKYQSLLEALDISDPVVANTLIDNMQIEGLLLIPTSEEAMLTMENQNFVPENCRLAINKNADNFYPAPNYKFYAGSTKRRQFMEVSTAEAIVGLQEELDVLQEEYAVDKQKLNECMQKVTANEKDVKELKTLINNLKMLQIRLGTQIEQCKESLEIRSDDLLEEHKSEVQHLTGKVEELKVKQQNICQELRESQKQLDDLNEQMKQRRNLKQNLDTKIAPLQEQITELNEEKKRLERANRGNIQRLEEAKSKMQTFRGQQEQQQRVVNKEVEKAEDVCPRISTRRSPDDLESTIRDIAANIAHTEKQHGDLDALKNELDGKESKRLDVQTFANNLENSINKQQERLEKRRKIYENMKEEITESVRHSFSTVLKLRNYKGQIDIDHRTKKLELEVTPSNDAKRSTYAKDAKCLSGGERSYSTVAFILSLWDSTDLPFYFLDEPDVYMDKINRRLSMDILLHHARKHPRSQFAFLTPLDTSNINSSNDLGVFRLEPPERRIE